MANSKNKQFPAVLTRVMVAYKIHTQTLLAKKLGKNRNYIHDLATGDRNPTPQFIDLLTQEFLIQEPLRTQLHRAGAIDHGYKINVKE